jgi:3-oxoacyl-[acyl-carrier protein] reductase
MNYSLKNKIIIVTGAASGIGRTITETFLSQGALICGLDRHALPYNQVNLHGFELDITDEKSVNHIITTIAEKYGRIDALINNAGIQIISEIIKFNRGRINQTSDVG